MVIAHPLAGSLCHDLARCAIDTLTAAGHAVEVEDLYRDAFPPALTAAERRSYYGPRFDGDAVRQQIGRLRRAEGIVLVFPTWWFGFPAILKGWFDRVWAPGVAYDHASDLGPIKPRLRTLDRMLAVTTLGAARWVDLLGLRQPVRRVLKIALVGACAPRCRFEMLSLYQAEAPEGGRVERFRRRMRKALGRWG